MDKILLAGDRFVTAELLQQAAARHCPETSQEVRSFDWPLTPMGDVEEVHEAQGDVDEMIAALQGCTAAVAHTAPFTERVFEACPDLRLVAIGRGGPVNVNIEAATRHGVQVSCAPGRNATATAEHSVAMILGAMRQITQRHMELAAGQWRGDHYQFELVGPEVSGTTVGIIGGGNIGSRVASIMIAMGAQVLIFDPWMPDDRIPAGASRAGTLEELLSASSVVTLHARATAENKGHIGAEQIAMMPPDSVLVNCARGSLLNYDAMCDALDSGHLYAAACDVLPQEPLPADSRLLRTPRLTLTPHLAGASKRAALIAADLCLADVAHFLSGERPINLVNPEVLDGIA